METSFKFKKYINLIAHQTNKAFYITNKNAMKLPLLALLIKLQFLDTLTIVQIGIAIKFINTNKPWIYILTIEHSFQTIFVLFVRWKRPSRAQQWLGTSQFASVSSKANIRACFRPKSYKKCRLSWRLEHRMRSESQQQDAGI
jgi:hypothetical protein